MDGEHLVFTEGGVIALLLLGQRALVGLVPVLLLLQVLCLALEPSLDDVGHVHQSGAQVLQTGLACGRRGGKFETE